MPKRLLGALNDGPMGAVSRKKSAQPSSFNATTYQFCLELTSHHQHMKRFIMRLLMLMFECCIEIIQVDTGLFLNSRLLLDRQF